LGGHAVDDSLHGRGLDDLALFERVDATGPAVVLGARQPRPIIVGLLCLRAFECDVLARDRHRRLAGLCHRDGLGGRALLRVAVVGVALLVVLPTRRLEEAHVAV